jgi:uncharacterized protein (DUF305 family)
MQKNTGIIIAVIALVVGLGIGHVHGASIAKKTNGTMSGMHQTPDGSMRGNGGNAMSMADMMASMNAELEGKTGDEFDKAFLSEMIMHHEGAVGMAQAALTNANHQEIKDLANAIISAQNQEISQMKAWQKSWYGIEVKSSGGMMHNMQ